MKYGVIVHSPNLLPYVVPVDEPTAKNVTEVYNSGSLVAPMFVIDFEAGEIFRVFEDASGFSLADKAKDKLGKNTKRDPDKSLAKVRW